MPFHGYEPGKKRRNWPLLMLSILFIGIAAGAAILTSQKQADTGFRVESATLELSTMILNFGIVQANSVTVLPLTISNTGNVDLVLSYMFQITGNPSWAVLHITTGGAFNEAGAVELTGQLLTQTGSLNTIVALEVGLGAVGGDYTGTITISGSTPA